MNKLFLFYIIFINILGFSIMYIDKLKAIKKQWRIKESTLILISLVGGSFGSIISMYTFRHKTRHIKFTFGIPLIILLQITIINLIN
ncbi:DUF1294 domain-containing protein [Romboutsia maritimum]|uniref:DUF1294 domain-containing protein n=1 Tax=Romboutsia maritimum TaxID=2020948 RepID=A0A371IQN1_9FIRM|nr:DUF1294 domain-containing protein [Romboutsia maritimum]RDY22795.1 DUF1294 domain-containing protein [Romboutsia maritimum]